MASDHADALRRLRVDLSRHLFPNTMTISRREDVAAVLHHVTELTAEVESYKRRLEEKGLTQVVELRAENERLRGEVERLRAELWAATKGPQQPAAPTVEQRVADWDKMIGAMSDGGDHEHRIDALESHASSTDGRLNELEQQVRELREAAK